MEVQGAGRKWPQWQVSFESRLLPLHYSYIFALSSDVLHGSLVVHELAYSAVWERSVVALST
jgi:hypothetical protein